MKDIKKLFGLRIKELRLARNWTQDCLAEKLSMETQNVSRMEKGVHMPNIARIELLAEIFGVNVYELFIFNHFTDREQLIKLINLYLNEADLNTLRFLYKIISADNERRH